ncbi:hypothetical protein FA09DRAFT_361294 [Tilletiopsis washingtonensis]|uniref:Uncharacterized protein n=1 Tax=Tilletiopsis washingtonensis TaxID=58919 RepID=A0A316Z7E2_9BASI|nr:hypothetical protein FA09DRAFT_361294 [Tilletiopsis washingtonensis]PWN97491.1 hypothetical protein FA09DRAFT_361294 [Tilletiopsis washingtonensis]
MRPPSVISLRALYTCSLETRACRRQSKSVAPCYTCFSTTIRLSQHHLIHIMNAAMQSAALANVLVEVRSLRAQCVELAAPAGDAAVSAAPQDAIRREAAGIITRLDAMIEELTRDVARCQAIDQETTTMGATLHGQPAAVLAHTIMRLDNHRRETTPLTMRTAASANEFLALLSRVEELQRLKQARATAA